MFPFQVLMPVANGSDEIEVVAIVDVLRCATTRVVVAAFGDNLEVVGARKVKLLADVVSKKLNYLTTIMMKFFDFTGWSRWCSRIFSSS